MRKTVKVASLLGAGLVGVVAGVVLVLACGQGPDKAAAGDTGGSCTCTLPSSVVTVTADSDPARQALVNTIGGGQDGPLMVTDVSLVLGPNRGQPLDVFTVGNGAPCVIEGRLRYLLSTNQDIHGARLFVRADERVCMTDPVTYALFGFRPYGT